MLKFSLKVLSLLLLISVSLIGLPLLTKNRLQGTYLASMVDKHHRLDSLHSPRLILMGGSSMAFGTDSKLLADSLKMPVQNLATQIVLGTKFMLNEARSTLRKGDIVLVGFEYHIQSKGSIDQQLLAADNYKPALDFIEFLDWKSYVSAKLLHQIGNVKLTLGMLLAGRHDVQPSITDSVSVFFRKGFSPEGDLLSHLNNPQQLPLQHAELPTHMEEYEILQDLTKFCKFAKQLGVQVYYVFPPYAAGAYQKNEQTVQEIYRDFQTLRGITILGKPQDFVYPDSLFFDSVYHLNGEGRRQRSEQLVKLLAAERGH